VLIASLSSVLLPPGPTPVPLSGLLLVVGPGFELAMGVLTAEAITAVPGARGAAAFAEPAGSSRALTLAQGSGSGVPEPKEPGQESSEPDTPSGPDWKTHDAAILDLLSGIADALALRPPSLPLDIDAEAQAPGDSASEQPGAGWLSQSLVWLARPETARLIGLIPMPTGLLPMAGAALAAIRQWFAFAGASDPNWAAPGSSDLAPEADSPCLDLSDRIDQPSSDPPTGDPPIADLWLAAACALGLVHGVWSGESSHRSLETAPRRARFLRRTRPTTC
jgi:hypothetical protein